MSAPLIHAKMVEVSKLVGHIGKDHRYDAAGTRFDFRGIDDALNAFHKAFCEVGISPVPDIISYQREERKTSTGKPVTCTVVHMRVKFYAEDGSFVEASTIGEGNDTADKGSGKAMSTAFKYALFFAFCIPVKKGTMPQSEDTDYDTEPRDEPQRRERPSAPAASGDPTAYWSYVTKNKLNRGEAQRLLADHGNDFGKALEVIQSRGNGKH